MPVIAYIGIGSNIGDSMANCRKSIELLAEAGKVVSVSSFYHTEPVGRHEQDDFINAVAALETERSPGDLLNVCHAIEDRLGRRRGIRWGPRTADLDILLYGDLVIDQPDLTIPHPQMALRKFVLAPLAEIAPEVTHPRLCKSVLELYRELKDPHTVIKCRQEAKTP